MFYDNLKAECTRQNIKMTPLINKCGGSTGKISSWKKGALPNSEIVMKLAVLLNVTTDYLLFGRNKECTEDEQRLIYAYRSLTDEGKRVILSFAEMAADNPQYKNFDNISKEA